MICNECKLKGGIIKASTVKKLLQNSYSDRQKDEIDGFIEIQNCQEVGPKCIITLQLVKHMLYIGGHRGS